MNVKFKRLQWVASFICVQALLFAGTAPNSIAVDSLHSLRLIAASVSQRYQSQESSNDPIDFEEDDALDQSGRGINAIYVDNRGNVLGTFVNIPGAKIKVFASGEIEIEERDYTTEIDYYSDGRDGRIREIGNVRFRYYSNDRIREIGNIDFTYRRNGQLERIDALRFRYFANGRIKEIDNVRFDYESASSDLIETISSSYTQGGIRIVIVN